MSYEMNVREKKEANEKEYLSKYAALSVNTRGRDKFDEPCDIRTCYQRDRDRIIHSKAFRRLKHKTQVFLSPAGDHYRTRLTHTLEVSQIARTIATSLFLNEDLTEAIALGHDLGHTPFGHAGERALASKYEFRHSEQSVRVVELLEKDGRGLNLTWEVRDGIKNHSMSGRAATLEGRIVRLADKIAYIHHDMDDALRAGILKEEQVPNEIRKMLGGTRQERLDFLVKDIINCSQGKPDILMTPEVYEAMVSLRQFMFDNLYFNPICKSEEGKVQGMIVKLFDYFLEHTDEMPGEYIYLIKEKGENKKRVVCDFISGMTDQYSVDTFNRLFVPRYWDAI